MKSLYPAGCRPAMRLYCALSLAFFLALTAPLSALDYYWVNGSGLWSDFANHWAKIPNPTLPAHYHANVPTADDDVYFGDTNGGAPYTVTVDAGSTVPKCRSMDWTGVPAGTVWGGSGSRIDIYGSVMLQAGMVISYSGEIQFLAIGPTHTITSNGVHFGTSVTFDGTAGGWQLVDDFFVEGSMTHSGGLLETMGQTVTIRDLFFGGIPGTSANSNGQLHLSSSEFNVLANSAYFYYDASQFDAGTSHIKLYSSFVYLFGSYYFLSPTTFHDVSFFGACGTQASPYGGLFWGNISGTLTFHQFGAIHSYSWSGIIPELNNVIFHEGGHIYNANHYNHLTLSAGKTYTIQDNAAAVGSVLTGTDQTILPGGTLTALGAGTCAEFITIKSWQYGTHFNFVNNSGAKQTVHCVILEDCHATGSDPLEVLDGVDLGNTTGWTFTDPNPGIDLYWIGGAGDWNDPSHWSDTDGGTPGTCIPNGGSNVHFTALSGFSPSDVVNVPEDAYCKNMDWSGVTGEPEFYQSEGIGRLFIYGSLTLSPDMDFNFGGRVHFRANSTATITSAGQAFPYVVILEGAGAWELQDAFEAAAHPVYHSRGTFKTMGHPMRVCRWWGNQYEFGPWTPYNQGAELFLSDMGGNSSTVTLVKSTYSGQKGDMYPWYEAGKFHAAQSHIIGEEGGLVYGWPGTPHDFWDVTFLPVGSAGDFLHGNILHKLTFFSFGNLSGNNTYIHEAEFRFGGYIFDSHTYEILTLYGTGGPQYKFEGNTVQTITATGTFNLIDANCEAPAYLHNPTPGYSTTFRKEGGGTLFNIQHAILDRIYPDQTTGAVYTATNCIAVQSDVETAWNMSNPPARDLYWVDGPGDWHNAAHWSLASGGPGGECPPTPADNVFFNGSSNLGAGDAVTVSRIAAFCKDMDWTGVGNGAVLNNSNVGSYQSDPYAFNTLFIFGSIAFSNAMTNNFQGSVFLRANRPAMIKSAGNQFNNSLYFWEPDGDWSLTDDLSIKEFAYHNFGILRSNGHNLTVGGAWEGNNGLNIGSGGNPELFLDNSTLTILSINTPFGYGYARFQYSPGKTHTASANIVFEDNYRGVLSCPFTHPVEFKNVTFKAANSYCDWGQINNKLLFEKSGTLTEGFFIKEVEFWDDAQFNINFTIIPRDVHSIRFAPGKRYAFQSQYTLNIIPHNGVEGQFIAQGLPGQFIELKSSDINSPATIHMDDYNGTSTCTKYLFLTGMHKTGTEDIYVPTPGGDVFNNSGWQFFPCNPCPASIPVLDPAGITTGCPPGKAKLILAGLKPDEWANWYTDPAATTNLVYSGGLGGNLFEPDITGPTTYYARVYSDGGLCESTVVLSVDITITTPPATFNMTGGGTVCAGGNGAPVGLDGSAAGVSYQLLLDGSPVGAPLPGTGAALDFGLQTAPGSYTVVATPDGTACPAVMSGTAVVTGDPNQAPVVAVGSNSPVYSSTTDLELTESGGAAVSWAWSGPNGFASVDQNPMINNLTPTNSGAYTVVVTGANGCTNAAIVAVVVSPLEIICPDNISQTLEPGACSAVVSYVMPMITGGAGGQTITQISGLPSGAAYPLGNTINCFRAEDVQGNTADCCFVVTVNPFANPVTSIVCNNLTEVTLDQDCQHIVSADEILQGSLYACYDNYTVEIDKDFPYGDGPWAPAVLGASDIGMTYAVQVTDPATGNSCKGNLEVVDNLPPQMSCQDITVNCEGGTSPPAVTDCQSFNLNWSDFSVQINPSPPPAKTIFRRWTATDGSNNMAGCTQKITVLYGPPAVNSFCFLLECEDAPGSGQASFDLTESGFCLAQGMDGMAFTFFEDENLGMPVQAPNGFVSGPGIVYVLATSTISGCTASGSVFLSVTPGPVMETPQSQNLCAGESTAPINFSGNQPGVVFDWTNDNPAIGLPASGTGDIGAFVVQNNTGEPVTATITVVPKIVDDTTPPTCTPPGNVTVDCNSFDASLTSYGFATGADDCCLQSTTVTNNFNLFNQDCRQGTIIRIFRATDCVGLTSICTQRITVNHTQNYAVRFPDDVIADTPHPSGDYGVPEFSGEDCELLATSFQDVILTNIPDACLKIERTWTIVNWCTFNPVQSCTMVPNPNPESVPGHPANLAGPVVSETGTAAPWAPTVASVLPGAPLTDYSTFWNPTVNCYTYTQHINIINCGSNVDAIKPKSSVDVRKQGMPDRAMVAEDNRHEDVRQAEIEPALTALEAVQSPMSACGTCIGQAVTFTITVYPTPALITPANLVACAGTILAVPAFSGAVGGTEYFWTNSNPAVGLPASGVGNLPAFVAQNPGATPVTAMITVTPRFTDGMFSCEGQPVAFTITVNPANMMIDFEVIATPPSCNGASDGSLTVTNVSGGMAPYQYALSGGALQSAPVFNGLSVGSFLIKVQDDKACMAQKTVELPQGPDLPLAVTCPASVTNLQANASCQAILGDYTALLMISGGCDIPLNPVVQTPAPGTLINPGTVHVTLSTDNSAGESATCGFNVRINGGCGGVSAGGSISGKAMTEDGTGIGRVTVTVSGPGIFQTVTTENTGEYGFHNLPLGREYEICMSRTDDYRNGLNTFDLTLLSAHILGDNLLDSPYKIIAGEVGLENLPPDDLDLEMLRMLLLFEVSELPAPSWKFIPADYVFPDPMLPFASSFPQGCRKVFLNASSLTGQDFIGVKTGEMNGSANPE